VDVAKVKARLRRRSPPQRPTQPIERLYPELHRPNPATPETPPVVLMFAIIKAWMDEDVIEATVCNAIIQGADAVYVVDNGSTDETVDIARAAGATVAEVYHTDAFDGPLAQTVMNGVVARESLRAGAEHIWWHYLDSDEFAEGPDGRTVREYLATLDRQFRIVGSTFVNHVPSAAPQYLSGFHPLDFQPLGYTFTPSWMPTCGLDHWKHPLQRFDRHSPFVVCQRGSHGAYCAEPLVEPSVGITTHHFQYRDETTTKAKLELTRAQRTGLYGSDGLDGFSRRSRSVDAVYAQRWEEVETEAHRTLADVDGLQPWPRIADVRRWYTPEDLDTARSAWTAKQGDAAVNPS
jgi:glycosyltransferase involved in cell wall biosynthesis